MEYDYSVDVWSLGILTYELIIGNAPFQGRNNDETFDEIVNVKQYFSFFIKSILFRHFLHFILRIMQLVY